MFYPPSISALLKTFIKLVGKDEEILLRSSSSIKSELTDRTAIRKDADIHWLSAHKMQIYTQKMNVQPVSMKEASLARWYFCLKGS